MNIGSLFSGAGGLDLAVEGVFAGGVVWHSEIEPAACLVLEHQFPDAVNLGDISQINWDAVQPVDVLCGGFPCQDVSTAATADILNQAARFHVKYAIWEETYCTPSGIRRWMADRGSVTANHYDHVHLTVES